MSLRTADVAAALGVQVRGTSRVALNEARIATIGRHLQQLAARRPFERAAWNDPLFWNVEAPAEQRSQFFAVGNAINFRFWEFDGSQVVPAAGVIGGNRFRGAMYMWRCLRRAGDDGAVPILEARFLADIDEETFEVLFSDDNGNNPLRVGWQDRIENLRDLGRRLEADWDGTFLNVLAASRGSIVEFAKLSSQFRAFDDPLFKLTMVNAIVHAGSGVYAFQDEPLPAIDYHLLRQALRQGMVEPDAALRTKLVEGELLTSDEGLLLRAAALAAYVRLADISGASGEIIDNMYWLNRVNCGDQPVCLDPATARQCSFFEACTQFAAYRLPLELTRYY